MVVWRSTGRGSSRRDRTYRRTTWPPRIGRSPELPICSKRACRECSRWATSGQAISNESRRQSGKDRARSPSSTRCCKNEGRLQVRPRGSDIDGNMPPLALAKSDDAESRSSEMPEHDRQPDVGRLKVAHRLEYGTEADRHRDLRDDRDVQRATGVAGALQAAGVGEGHGNEEARDAQKPEQFLPERPDERLG